VPVAIPVFLVTVITGIDIVTMTSFTVERVVIPFATVSVKDVTTGLATDVVNLATVFLIEV
jgi:hypothetical protein